MKTIRTILSVLLCAVLTLGVFPVLAPAESDVLLSGECGETGANLTWTLRANGYLTVRGEGAMADFTGSTAPWTAALRDGTLAAKLSQTAQTPQEAQSDWDAMVRAYILPEYIVIEEGVTSVSADAFNGWYARGVVLPSSLRTGSTHTTSSPFLSEHPLKCALRRRYSSAGVRFSCPSESRETMP